MAKARVLPVGSGRQGPTVITPGAGKQGAEWVCPDTAHHHRSSWVGGGLELPGVKERREGEEAERITLKKFL